MRERNRILLEILAAADYLREAVEAEVYGRASAYGVCFDEAKIRLTRAMARVKS